MSPVARIEPHKFEDAGPPFAPGNVCGHVATGYFVRAPGKRVHPQRCGKPEDDPIHKKVTK